jgi:hypothetical protein
LFLTNYIYFSSKRLFQIAGKRCISLENHKKKNLGIGKVLGVISLVTLLIVVSILSISYFNSPQIPSESILEDGTSYGTQSEVLQVLVLPEYNIGGSLVALILCLMALGFFMKHKKPVH